MSPFESRESRHLMEELPSCWSTSRQHGTCPSRNSFILNEKAQRPLALNLSFTV